MARIISQRQDLSYTINYTHLTSIIRAPVKKKEPLNHMITLKPAIVKVMVEAIGNQILADLAELKLVPIGYV